MRILTTPVSSFVRNTMDRHTSQVEKTQLRLSTGLRINSAADDAAGLGISNRMQVQVRGMNQAVRNMVDAQSMLRTTESALSSITDQVQRLRELAVQAANDAVYDADSLQMIQKEASQILAGIDRISQETQYNGQTLLGAGSSSGGANDPDHVTLLNRLKSSWLAQGEQLVQQHFGLAADGQDLEIVFQDGAQPYLAAVSGFDDGSGKLTGMQLLVAVDSFLPADATPDGGTAPYYNDRIIAHEMVHAVMGRTMNYTALDTWFQEGAAEFIHGGDERMIGDLAAAGGNAGTIVSDLANAWAGTSQDYSAGYAAVRYMHHQIKASGGSGIRDVMSYLSANPASTLNDALTNASSGAFASQADFMSSFAADGADYINNTGAFAGTGLNLANTDTGGIGGEDADGGATKDAQAAVPDVENYSEDPLSGFAEIYPFTVGLPVSGTFSFQVGAGSDDTLQVSLSAADSLALGLNSVDLSTNAAAAIGSADQALRMLDTLRGELGGAQNRLDSSISVTENAAINTEAARSRIMDADFAAETSQLTASQILQQASVAVLAQANAQPQSVLALLNF